MLRFCTNKDILNNNKANNLFAFFHPKIFARLLQKKLQRDGQPAEITNSKQIVIISGQERQKKRRNCQQNTTQEWLRSFCYTCAHSCYIFFVKFKLLKKSGNIPRLSEGLSTPIVGEVFTSGYGELLKISILVF